MSRRAIEYKRIFPGFVSILFVLARFAQRGIGFFSGPAAPAGEAHPG
jgi:hypothetical protein